MSAETFLIVGGTGTFGREATRQLLAHEDVRKVRILSRDEKKQADLKAEFPEAVRDGRLLTMLGDVRDLERVERACEGATHVLHAAALKRVEACQGDVEECILTNVLGSLNVAKAAERQGVEAAVLVSSDKAVDPVNVYGVSKLMAEHVFLGLSSAWGARSTRLVAVRYGNVFGSRGSVVEAWSRAAAEGRAVELRDPDATRYFLSIQRGVALALVAARRGQSGHLYVPMMSAARLGDLAEAFGVETKVSGLLGSEKKHESLLSEQEFSRAVFSADVAAWQVPPATGASTSAPRFGRDTVRSSETATRLSVPELAAIICGEVTL